MITTTRTMKTTSRKTFRTKLPKKETTETLLTKKKLKKLEMVT